MLFGPDRTKGAEAEFLKLATEFTGKFIFTTVGGGTDPELWRFIGSDEQSDKSELFLFKPEEGQKYKLQGLFTFAKAKKFLNDYLDGTLKPYLKSADVKEGWDKETIKDVVATQVSEMVADTKRGHIVLMVYAPFCGHCTKFKPQYEKAAAYFESKYGEEVVFAKMDGTENEVEGIKVQGFPTILVFPKGMDPAEDPIDISKETSDLKLFAKEIRRACNLANIKREGEAEYEEAAKRFKAAVRAVKGPLFDAAAILNEASTKVEKILSA